MGAAPAGFSIPTGGRAPPPPPSLSKGGSKNAQLQERTLMFLSLAYFAAYSFTSGSMKLLSD